MSKVLLLFDYVYYRTYKFFRDKGDSISEFSATLVLSIIQCFTLLNILVFIRMFNSFPLPNKLVIIPVVVIIGIMNWLRYERYLKIDRLEHQWREEDQKKKILNGWLIGLYLLIALLIPVMHGYLEHNLNVI